MDNITRPLTQRLTRRLVFDLELLHYDSGTGGGVPAPPAGFGWVTFMDGSAERIVTYTDQTGAVRPVMRSLAA